MKKINLQQVLMATQGTLLSEVKTQFLSIGTDTRKDLSDALFIALKGDQFDAHQFLEIAVNNNAAALLVHEVNEQVDKLRNQCTIVLVEDTLKALQNLGHWARQHHPARFLAMTGSNGKTSTKEFAAAIISTVKRTHFNHGSFNNHWGVPMTLLQTAEDAEVALIEMGMNHLGEITELVKIAEPDVVVCTMVGKAHIEHFGDIDKIAEAKSEIYEASGSEVVRIFNLDNAWTKKMYNYAQILVSQGTLNAKNIFTFSSLDSSAHVCFKIQKLSMSQMTIAGQIQGVPGSATVNVFGTQNLTNLLAAATLALTAGLTPEQIWNGLSFCKTNWGRNQLVNLKSGAQMIFDAYNANPDSMKALIENIPLLSKSSRKIGIFGEMLEMGPQSPELHKDLGLWVGQAGFDKVYFVGEQTVAFQQGLEQAQYTGFQSIEKKFSDSVAAELGRNLNPSDVLLVKGSRGMKLERFVQFCDPIDFTLKT